MQICIFSGCRDSTFLEPWRKLSSWKPELLAPLFVFLVFSSRRWRQNIINTKLQYTSILLEACVVKPVISIGYYSGFEPCMSHFIAIFNFNIICKERTEILSAQLLTSYFWVCIVEWKGHKIGWTPSSWSVLCFNSSVESGAFDPRIIAFAVNQCGGNAVF